MSAGCPWSGAAGDRGRVVDHDSHDRTLAPDPFASLARIREVGPMTWSRSYSGYWVATGFDAVATAARDPRLVAGHVRPDGSFQGVTTPPLGQTGRLVPLELNPPESLKYRRLLGGFFSARRVKARMDELRTLAATCIDDVIESGSCDLVPALTMRLPSVVTLRDIGIPEDRWQDLDDVVERGLLCAPHDTAGAREAAMEACLDIVDAMEEGRGADDGGLMSTLLGATIDGHPLEEEEIVSAMYLLLLGIHPTSTFAATALWYLAQHPDLRARLVADPALVPASAEEFVRWVCPIQSTTRSATEDVHLAGRDIAEGDRVFMSWAAANRDPEVFPDGDVVDLDRDTSGHLGFGGGVHYCLGAHLVRAMYTVMVEEVLRRMPDYRVADESAIRWFPDVSFAYGVTALPVVFTPGRRSFATVPQPGAISATAAR